MQAGLKQFNEAARRAKQAFRKAMDAAAAGYLEGKDLASSQAVEGRRRGGS